MPVYLCRKKGTGHIQVPQISLPGLTIKVPDPFLSLMVQRVLGILGLLKKSLLWSLDLFNSLLLPSC